MYKRLLWLGREWHQGPKKFNKSLNAAFSKNKNESDPEKIEKLIARAEFVEKEIMASTVVKLIMFKSGLLLDLHLKYKYVTHLNSFILRKKISSSLLMHLVTTKKSRTSSKL